MLNLKSRKIILQNINFSIQKLRKKNFFLSPSAYKITKTSPLPFKICKILPPTFKIAKNHYICLYWFKCGKTCLLRLIKLVKLRICICKLVKCRLRLTKLVKCCLVSRNCSIFEKRNFFLILDNARTKFTNFRILYQFLNQ